MLAIDRTDGKKTTNGQRMQVNKKKKDESK